MFKRVRYAVDKEGIRVVVWEVTQATTEGVGDDAIQVWGGSSFFDTSGVPLSVIDRHTLADADGRRFILVSPDVKG